MPAWTVHNASGHSASGFAASPLARGRADSAGGGGGGSSRVLIALLLVALVAAVLLAAPRKAEAEHVVWSATLTARVSSTSLYNWFGCFGTGTNACSTAGNLSGNTFTFGGTAYAITYVAYGAPVDATQDDPVVSVYLNKNVPAALLTHELVIGSSRLLLSTCTYDASDFPKRIFCYNPGVSWAAGASVSLSLENSAVTHGVDPEQARAERAEQERERERDMRKSARRGGGCGAPEDGLSPDSDEAGYWHCHGDSVYHRHAGTWRGSHQPGGDRPQPPGLRPEPRPPSQAERDAGFADNWNGGWHWHGDDIYHIHRSPH